MARTPSTMLELGTPAPSFELLEPATENMVSLQGYAGQPILIAFICNHCPYVIHIRSELAKLTNEYQAKGIAVVAINANDAENYPDDSPEKMVKELQSAGYGFPYLFDESQETAKAYQAACTPDFFLFDAEHALYYRGQFDDSRPSNDEPITGSDLRAALDDLLAGQPAPTDQKPSLGCNIKWKPDNAPDYFG